MPLRRLPRSCRTTSTTQWCRPTTRSIASATRPTRTLPYSTIRPHAVEPRNTPTTINAVFNHRNFWDGRANFMFNGQNPFGQADTKAVIMVNNPTTLSPTQIAIPFSSLASQAVGPMLSNFEMSYDFRAWANLGKKMLNSAIRPLAKQRIANDDSVLGPLVDASGIGLQAATNYRYLIQKAFKAPYYNNSGQYINLDSSGNPVIKNGTPSLTTDFTQIEFDFPFFFGLAVQAYEQTLVSDDAKYDKVRDSAPGVTLTSDEQAGFDLL